MPATDPFSRFSLASEGLVTSVAGSPSCEFVGSAGFVELVVPLVPDPGEICFLFISGFCCERKPPSSRFLMDDMASRRRHISGAAMTSFLLIKSGLIDLTSRRYLRFTGGMLHGSNQRRWSVSAAVPAILSRASASPAARRATAFSCSESCSTARGLSGLNSK